MPSLQAHAEVVTCECGLGLASRKVTLITNPFKKRSRNMTLKILHLNAIQPPRWLVEIDFNNRWPGQRHQKDRFITCTLHGQ